MEAYAARAGNAAGWGIFLFVFLMVVREGAELALILRAVELSTEGLQTWIGTLGGHRGRRSRRRCFSSKARCESPCTDFSRRPASS